MGNIPGARSIRGNMEKNWRVKVRSDTLKQISIRKKYNERESNVSCEIKTNKKSMRIVPMGE